MFGQADPLPYLTNYLRNHYERPRSGKAAALAGRGRLALVGG